MDNKRLNTRRGRDNELDAEILELEKEFRGQETDENDSEEHAPEPTNKEDEVWKKRYGDLRSHSSKTEAQLRAEKEASDNRVRELEAQLRSAVKEQSNFPESADPQTIKKWITDFPDVYSILAGIIREEIGESHEKTTKQLSEKVEAIERDRHELTKQKATQRVLEVHPDLAKIVASEDYQNWLVTHAERGAAGNKFSQAIYEALWVNETDADAAIEALNHYKQTKNRKSPKDNEAAALAPVARSNSSGPVDTSNKPVFKESQIDGMSHREYEKYEDAIEEARRDGRIVYDLTGAAR